MRKKSRTFKICKTLKTVFNNKQNAFGGNLFWKSLVVKMMIRQPVVVSWGWTTRVWSVSWTTMSTCRNGWTWKTPKTVAADDGCRLASSCSGRSVWPTMTICPSRMRTAGDRRTSSTWPVGHRRRCRCLRRRWPTRTHRQCTIRTGKVNRWPPTVPVWTAAYAGTSTPTGVRRVLRTPVRCLTWTSGRMNDEARRAGNNLR